MPVDSVEEVYRFLDSIPKFQDKGQSAARFDLDRFRECCEALGNIHMQFPAIHVGGSNGKGSTCYILGSVFRQAGLKTGVYTSPHLISYTERFRVDGSNITDEELLLFFKKHEQVVKKYDLTYFEISTAIAFWYFEYKKVDVGIIEVGLGGRLDATNIIMPMVSVITNITKDHTDILGPTLADIAREKAGIIKQGVPVVLGNLPKEAEEVITAVAERRQAPICRATELHPGYKDGMFEIFPPGKNNPLSLQCGLPSPVQKYNIAIAWQVSELLSEKFTVSEDEFREGVARVREAYPAHGRFEKLLADRQWYFDGAHNPDAIDALREMVATRGKVSDAVLVLAMMRDKVNAEVMEMFSDFKKIFYYELSTPRAADYETVREYLNHISRFPHDPKRQKQLFEEFESELVIFAGSFYFYNTVRDWLHSTAKNR